MLAERANDIVRKLVAFVDISADYAYISLLALSLRFWFYIALVIIVRHSLHVGDYAGFRDGTDEHSVCIQIYILLNLQGHERVDISWKEYQPVIGTQRSASGELVHSPSALEPEVLEYLERCIC